MNLKSAVYLVLISVLTLQAHAENTSNRVYSYYLSGDYQEAYRLWLHAAKDGNTNAQMSL